MTTHPHLEGLIRKYEKRRENWEKSNSSFAEGNAVQCRDIVDDLRELSAALAALPGGGADVVLLARDIHHAIADDGLAPRDPPGYNALRDPILRVLRAALSPTPPSPHEADRNG